ncbi:sigma associated protein [Actinorhabdospora filicis]|uniref:Sigma associated protein n=1 Tax=Actinorhabdospora filicis TaxID=1785913 RepID=A0A9W6WC34_9ACTN|nr:YciI family protein [Actinorhabdospora filicis]GLZ81244.1 sigma associated protein [Actinorhabdospora filicis]
MLLMQATREEIESMSEWPATAVRAHVDFMTALPKVLFRDGEIVDMQGLGGPGETFVVRASPTGEPIVTDGPFPETKEFLAGYWLVDVESTDRVREIAAFISAAPGPDGKPMNFPLHVQPIGQAPEV